MTSTGVRSGFTLVELLVVISIIAVLISLLLPSVIGVKREARSVRCQNNVRQLALAMNAYVGEFRQKYPPNVSAPAPGMWWYDDPRVGGYLPTLPLGTSPRTETVWVCPEDDGARRSYSMNYWASSKVDALPKPTNGTRWSIGAKPASKLVLLLESWSYQGTATAGFGAQPFVGFPGAAGQRFGGKGGLTPFPAGRCGTVTCEITFARHRSFSGHGQRNEPRGRTVIAFDDAHVELVNNDFLVGFETGNLTGNAYFSPFDAP